MGRARKRWRRARKSLRPRRLIGRLRKRGRFARKVLHAHLIAPPAWRKDLAALSQRTRTPIVVGPWTNEVGYELLYWIPLLRHACAVRKIDPERVIAVSRGGTASWYEPLATRYVEIFDLRDPEQVVRETRRRAQDRGGQWQLSASAEDEQMLREVGARLNLERFDALHPASMYRFLTGYLRGLRPAKHVLRQCDHSRFPARYARPAGLSFDGDYLVAKFYANPAFPKTAENQAFVDELLGRLSQRLPVVVLNTGLELDDHVEFEVPGSPDVHEARTLLEARDNLAVQSALVANSRGFVGTYGGFSYLPPLLGVQAVGVYSQPQFLSVHLGTSSVALSDGRNGGHSAIHTTAAELLLDALARPEARAGF